MSEPDYVKIELQTADGEDVHVETPWAVPLGGNRYSLANCPFYAYDVSFEDVVEAVPPAEGEFPIFLKVVSKSGNRTVRVIFEPAVDESEESRAILEDLEKKGCSYEGANSSYVVINIPPDVDLWEVCNYIDSTGQQWEHADPSYETLYPGGGDQDAP